MHITTKLIFTFIVLFFFGLIIGWVADDSGIVGKYNIVTHIGYGLCVLSFIGIAASIILSIWF